MIFLIFGENTGIDNRQVCLVFSPLLFSKSGSFLFIVIVAKLLFMAAKGLIKKIWFCHFW
jgi:hypothetical protein